MLENPQHENIKLIVTSRGLDPLHEACAEAGGHLLYNRVLFLDELPEFRRNVLEVMRQPLEDGNITVSRALGLLVGAMSAITV